MVDTPHSVITLARLKLQTFPYFSLFFWQWLLADAFFRSLSRIQWKLMSKCQPCFHFFTPSYFEHSIGIRTSALSRCKTWYRFGFRITFDDNFLMHLQFVRSNSQLLFIQQAVPIPGCFNGRAYWMPVMGDHRQQHLGTRLAGAPSLIFYHWAHDSRGGW